MKFIKHWKEVLISTSIIAFVFIIWDIIFTKQGVWGFNPDYYLGIKMMGMPIEEWLFFFCIPYASIFIHYAMQFFKPKLHISTNTTKLLVVVIFIFSIGVLGFNTEKLYTTINYSFLALSMLLGWFFGVSILRRFFISFIMILIPFFIVNGVLTGAFIEAPVVWYDNQENLGIRLGTIPVEDIGYAFSMLFLNILLFERLRKKSE